VLCPKTKDIKMTRWMRVSGYMSIPLYVWFAGTNRNGAQSHARPTSGEHLGRITFPLLDPVLLSSLLADFSSHADSSNRSRSTTTHSPCHSLEQDSGLS
jgi:hypothetical protein